MPTRLAIGEFSRLTHLSVPTLRRYHDLGLLEPAHVDGATGYRSYHPDQIPTAQSVRRLRDLEMPIKEIKVLIATEDPTAHQRLVADHLSRLEARLVHTQVAVAALRRLLDGSIDTVAVQRRTTQPTRVAAVHGVVDRSEVLSWYDGAMGELRAVLARAGADPTGPAGGIYEQSLFTDERGELIVYLPVTRPPAVGRVAPLDLPPVDVATTVHHGDHSDIDVTYGALGAWADRHGLAPAGPVHEIYLVGPSETTDPAAWRTEIGWPVAART